MILKFDEFNKLNEGYNSDNMLMVYTRDIGVSLVDYTNDKGNDAILVDIDGATYKLQTGLIVDKQTQDILYSRTPFKDIENRGLAEKVLKDIQDSIFRSGTPKMKKALQANLDRIAFTSESRFEKNEAVLGDIFYETWGYDQTNQTFYQVVKTTPKGCVVREIKYEIVGNKSGYNLVSPLKDQFVGNDILTKYVYYGSSLGLSNSKLQNTLYLWDNSPLQSDTSYR